MSGCTVPPDSIETELGSSDQDSSPSAGKNTGAVLVPCFTEVYPYSYFWLCGYLSGPWSIVVTDEFSVRVKKITSAIGVSWTHSLPFSFCPFLTQWVMALLSKGCKPDNF